MSKRTQIEPWRHFRKFSLFSKCSAFSFCTESFMEFDVRSPTLRCRKVIANSHLLCSYHWSLSPQILTFCWAHFLRRKVNHARNSYDNKQSYVDSWKHKLEKFPLPFVENHIGKIRVYVVSMILSSKREFRRNFDTHFKFCCLFSLADRARNRFLVVRLIFARRLIGIEITIELLSQINKYSIF